MKAQAGDQIVLAAVHVDGPTRSGEVVEVRGPDGDPPYVVRWSDGHIGVIYPGPGAVLRIGGHAPGEAPPVAGTGLGEVPRTMAAAAGPAGPGADASAHVREWTIRVSIFEAGDDTSASVVLLSDSTQHLRAHGTSHRSSTDMDVPEIGDEVAVARALRHLADELLDVAETDIEALTGESAQLRRG
jgi:hypothetical protein